MIGIRDRRETLGEFECYSGFFRERNKVIQRGEGEWEEGLRMAIEGVTLWSNQSINGPAQMSWRALKHLMHDVAIWERVRLFLSQSQLEWWLGSIEARLYY